MNWSRLAILTLLFVIIFTVSIFGGRFGYTVNGVPQGGTVEGKPGILMAIIWGWNALQFFFDMIFFQVDGMPEVFSFIFLLMALISIYILVSLFLPGGGD